MALSGEFYWHLTRCSAKVLTVTDDLEVSRLFRSGLSDAYIGAKLGRLASTAIRRSTHNALTRLEERP